MPPPWLPRCLIPISISCGDSDPGVPVNVFIFWKLGRPALSFSTLRATPKSQMRMIGGSEPSTRVFSSFTSR